MRTGWGIRRFVPVLLALVAANWACDDETSPVVTGCGDYPCPTSPEIVLANLQESYRQRDIEEYAKLLAPEFIYKFQTADYNEVPKGFWTHDEDSAGTRALFQTGQVEAIRIHLSALAPEPSNEVNHPLGTMKIRIVTTNLEVDQSDRLTLVASDQQEMFFRKGIADAGENSSQWLLFEWRDLESGSQAHVGADGPTPVLPITWGGLKNRYGPSPPANSEN